MVGPSRAGVVALTLAAGALVLSLVHPRVERAGARHRAESLAGDVETVRAALLRYRADRGGWPPGAPPGRVPDALSSELGGVVDFDTGRWTLDVERWEAVEVPPEREAAPVVPGAEVDSVSPPMPGVVELAGLTVRTHEATLLAVLLERYGAASFVRDSIWTLVLHPGVRGEP